MIIDEIADRPWGPTAADPTTAEDAIRALKKYELWKKIPASVRRHLEKAVTDKSLETPKPRDFEGLKVHNIILADNRMMCEAAEKRAKELGFNTLILSTKLEGESREAGIVLASIAREVEERGRPINPPAVLILGGETTVTITGRHGQGGPSQELALGSALKIAESKGIVVVSIDTDGTDGPTEIAGGIVDNHTVKRSERKNIDLFRSLRKHNSYSALMKLNDAVITGPTETNVMDLNLVVVMMRTHF
jgi:glycerate 2-kinase